MPNPPMLTLSEDFKQRNNISEVVKALETGQKFVYIVRKSDGSLMVVKRFKNCSQRDLQETELLKRFNEASGITKIIKVEEYGKEPILFEEFIEGDDLEDVMQAYEGNSKKITTLIKNIASTMQPIWAERIVHRDLKPKNIKILPNGDAVIMDFGIARDLSAESLTVTGEDQPMTWTYASPEQYAKDKHAISYRTDFFALGLIAYSLYYQRHPFGNTKEEIAKNFQDGAQIKLETDNPLNAFFEATLAIEPSSRPRTVDALIATL